MFGRNLLDFWCQNGCKLAPTWDQKLMFNWEGDFSKLALWLQRGLDLSGSGGPSWEQKSIEKWSPRCNASWHRFLNDFVGFWVPSWEGKSIKNQSKIASTKRCKKQSRLGRVLGRLRAVKGAATYSDPVRRDPAQPSGSKILSRRPPGPPPFRAKIPVKKETVLDVLTRLGPEARQI